MTKSQHEALRKWKSRSLQPRFNDVRTDVARRLFELGLVATSTPGDTFRSGYASLKLTAAGRDYLDWHP